MSIRIVPKSVYIAPVGTPTPADAIGSPWRRLDTPFGWREPRPWWRRKMTRYRRRLVLRLHGRGGR